MFCVMKWFREEEGVFFVAKLFSQIFTWTEIYKPLLCGTTRGTMCFSGIFLGFGLKKGGKMGC